MSDTFTPAEVFCLAEYLADEMTARGWTTSDVARRMGPGRNYVKDKLALDITMAVSPKRDGLLIDDDAFASLATAFGVSEQYLRNLHATWQKWPDRRSPFTCPEELYGTDVQFKVPD